MTKSEFKIIDNLGSLTIYNYETTGQEFINWNTGYGTFNNPEILINLNGTYLNTDNYTVFVTIGIMGTINADGISGNGDWIQFFNLNDDVQSVSGITTFIKS